jgi:integrase
MPRHGANIKQTAAGRWQASYRKLDGKEVSKTFDRRTDAAKWRRDGLASRDRGEYLDPKAGRITVAEYGERWRTAQLHHRASTRQTIEIALRKHVYPHIGDRPMNRVLRGDLQALVKRWEEDGAAPTTIKKTRYEPLRSMFLAAVRDDVISKTPCVGINLPEVITEQLMPLTAEQVEQIADAIDPRYRAMVLAGYGLGARISEVRGLTRPNVDFLGREVAIVQQLSHRAPYVLAPLKNSKRKPSRTVPAPFYVLEAFSEHIRTYGTGERELLFTSASGRAMNMTAISKPFRRACRSVGLPDSVSFHTLRHSFASEMLVQGLSTVEVAELIGDTVAMVESTYGHPTIDFRKRARLAVEAAWTARDAVAEPMRSVDASRGRDQR